MPSNLKLECGWTFTGLTPCEKSKPRRGCKSNHLPRLSISSLRSRVIKPWLGVKLLVLRSVYNAWSSSEFAFLIRPLSTVSAPVGSFEISDFILSLKLSTDADGALSIIGRDFQYSEHTWFWSIAWITCTDEIKWKHQDDIYLLDYISYFLSTFMLFLTFFYLGDNRKWNPFKDKHISIVSCQKVTKI